MKKRFSYTFGTILLLLFSNITYSQSRARAKQGGSIAHCKVYPSYFPSVPDENQCHCTSPGYEWKRLDSGGVACMNESIASPSVRKGQSARKGGLSQPARRDAVKSRQREAIAHCKVFPSYFDSVPDESQCHCTTPGYEWKRLDSGGVACTNR